MQRKLLVIVASLGLLGTAHQATASPVSPTDYFSQAVASAAFNNDTGNGVTAVPGVNTGQIAAPVAQVTNTATTIYSGIPGHIGANDTGQGPVLSTGSASALADRATGQLHAAAGCNTGCSGTIGFPAGATAQFGDTLTWTAPGASASTLTTIGFSVHLDSTLSLTGFGSGLPEVLFQVDVGSVPSFTNGFSPTVSPNAVGRGFQYAHQWYGQPASINLDITGTFSFTGDVATIPIFMSLFAGGQYGFADASNTATFSFTSIPTGNSFTSASGDFLTETATPLPATLPLFASGLGALGLLGWRRNRKAQAAA